MVSFVSVIQRLKAWARKIKTDIIAISLSLKDKRTPFLAKAIAVCIITYALSPIDLIPDFIPIFGYLDDIILVPFGIVIVTKLIPKNLMTELRAKAMEAAPPSSSRVGGVIVICIWIVALTASGFWILESYF